MCGIAGIFDLRGKRPIDQALLSEMNERQFHRGPDEGGMHCEPGVGLAHRRLSIIDLSSGQQPLFNEDGSVVVVYNGEIYNFPSLTKELIAAGHTFRTHCDTEVIVHAWEEWGARCVERFRGMFAFAIWDRSERTLFLARDRLGIKPLYYAVAPDGRLLFASELKSILAERSVETEYDPYAIEDFFALGYIPEPRSIFKSIRKLPPAHTLTIRSGQDVPSPREYWDVPFADNGIRTTDDATGELLERLEEAVRIRMIADVPLGAFLSGGVDSSAVVALMARQSSQPVQTCSISFGEAEFNESEHAQAVAQLYGTDHTAEQVSSDDFDLIDRLANLYDEPFADSSAMPTYRVCELARKRVTVALSGDGGDENFAGYRRYRWHMHEERFRNAIPGAIRHAVFGTLGAAYPKIDWAPKIFRAKSTFQAIARDSVEGYFHNFSVLPDKLRSALYSQRLRKELGGYHARHVFEAHLANAPDHPLSRVQYLDMKTYLPGDILTKVDRASMAHALEVRVPVLDHEFVEWVSGLPPGLKLHSGEGKHVFKRALEPLLPREILYRKKMGFAVPLARWFRGPLRDRIQQTVLGPHMLECGLFEEQQLRGIVNQHLTGQRDFSAAIWSLLMFESSWRQIQGNANRAVDTQIQAV